MGKISVAIGNYVPGGFGGVNTHITQILSAAKRYDNIDVHPFNLRDSKLSIILQSLHEFTHMRDTPYVAYSSRKFADFDVVHVHASLFSLYAALRAKKQYCSSVVVTHHTAADPDVILEKISTYPYHIRAFYRRFMWGLLESYSEADLVIAVAKWVRKDLRKYWGIKAEYIPNMVDPDEVVHTAKSVFVDDPRINGKDYVVWLGGRVIPPSIKRPQDFVAVARAFPDIPFVIPGKGITLQLLRSVVGDVPNNLVVIDTSRYGDHRAAFLNVVSRANVAVLTSYYETFGYTILEALSLGVPVVVPDAGGPPEIVSNAVGSVFRTADVNSLANEFVKMWCTVQSGGYAPNDLYEYVQERYSVGTVVPRILGVYGSLQVT